MNLVDPTKVSSNMEGRLVKYAFRGFRVALPGFSPELVSIFTSKAWDNLGIEVFITCAHK